MKGVVIAVNDILKYVYIALRSIFHHISKKFVF